MRLPIIVRHSNLGAISCLLPRFIRGIAGFLLINWPTPCAPELGMFRWARLPKLRSARAKTLS